MMLSLLRITLWHARPLKCNLKTSSFPWFYPRKVVNQRSGRCVFCFFCKNRWEKLQHGCWCCVQVCTLLKKIPFCHSQVPSNPCAALVRCVKGPTDRFWLSVGRFLWPQVHLSSVTCPWNHIRGPQTAQQAPTGELMMFFATMVSLFTQQTVNNIPGCHYCLRYNKRRKNLHLCCPVYLFGATSCYTEGQCILNNIIWGQTCSSLFKVGCD